MDIDLLYSVLARCDVYLKLEGVTIEKSNRATLMPITLHTVRTAESECFGPRDILLHTLRTVFFDAGE